MGNRGLQQGRTDDRAAEVSERRGEDDRDDGENGQPRDSADDVDHDNDDRAQGRVQLGQVGAGGGQDGRSVIGGPPVTLATLSEGGLLTATALRLPVDTSADEAAQIGRLLGDFHDTWQWAIGDFIIGCEQLFGQAAYQIIESLRISEESRAQYVRVAQSITPERRRSELTWSHHRSVYALEPPEQDAWLERAVENQWSKRELEAQKNDEPAFRPNTKNLLEIANALYEDARPGEDGDWTVDGALIVRLGSVLGVYEQAA